MKTKTSLNTTRRGALLIAVTAVALFVFASARAEENSSSVRFRFPVGITYVNGIHKLTDAIEANHPVEFDFVWPIGLSLNPYVEWTRTGLGSSLGVGPVTLGLGDANFYIVPLSLDLRYAYPKNKSWAPYARAGARWPFAGGDFIGNSSLGFFGAVGLEFGRTRKAGWSLEVGYDTSKVEVEAGRFGRAKDVKPGGLLVTLSVVF